MNAIKQIFHFNTKSQSNDIDMIYAGIDFAEFNSTQLGIFNSGFVCQFFDRHLFIESYLSNSLANN